MVVSCHRCAPRAAHLALQQLRQKRVRCRGISCVDECELATFSQSWIALQSEIKRRTPLWNRHPGHCDLWAKAIDANYLASPANCASEKFQSPINISASTKLSRVTCRDFVELVCEVGIPGIATHATHAAGCVYLEPTTSRIRRRLS